MKASTRHAAFLAIACTLGASYAFAGDPDASDTAAARALGTEGVRLADAGNCAEAEDKLSRAEKLHHAPTTLARLGECQIALGHLVEGSESLQRVVREVLPQPVPPAFAAAQDRAKMLLDQTRPRIGRSRISVRGLADGVTATVKVDGAPINAAMLDTDRPIDPGEHRLEVTADGYIAFKSSFTVKEGAGEAVTVTMQTDPNWKPPTPVAPPPVQQPPVAPPPVAPPPTQPDEVPHRNWVPVGIAGGVGIVGLGLWGGFGLAAMSQKSDLDTACKNGVCPEAERSHLDSAKTNATIAGVGLGVGIAGIVAAGVLYFVTTPSATPKEKTTATVTPLVGPGSIGLAGTF